MPAVQKAVVVTEGGGPEVLQIVTDHPIPHRKPGEVMVRLTSTSVNPVDTYVRSGMYKPEGYPKVLGGDVAGVVEEADATSKFVKGDSVFALTPNFVKTTEGSYCQYVNEPETSLACAPSSLPLDEAGAVPLVALTAWQALQPTGKVAGQRVLITAAAGGVGHFAVQFAKAAGMYVVGTAGPDNQAFLKEIGCDESINYREQDASSLFANDLFDVVVDLVGGADGMRALAKLVKPNGWYVHVLNRGTDNGVLEEIKQSGSLRSHTVYVQPNGEQLGQIAQLMDQGKVKPHVSAKFPLEDVAKAHQMVETWHVRGKVVLTID